jgi:regulator of sirC expression with transglutaminase-like and TPR domain
MQALDIRGDDPITWYDAARVYARLNQDAQALEALRRALDMGYPRALARADANFADIAADL